MNIVQKQRLNFLAIFVLSVAGLASAEDRDWPMWRNDAYRSAATRHSLPDRLAPHWRLQFSPRVPAWDDPLNLDLMTYDRIFEPVVMDGRLFLAFNDRDRIIACSTHTGETLWTYYTDSPIRFAPVGWQGKLYLTADDGYLHCLDASTGERKWRLRGGPSDRLALGNKRLVSCWPARGGPVIRDGVVYFSASIWPFMGTFLYAVNAETGEIVWVNDSTGPQYIKQPHSAPSFAGVAPQGALSATQDRLVVPGGRSVPAVFDRHTGEQLYYEINAGGKGTGGSFVVTNETEYYVHTRLKGTRQFDLESGLKTAFMPNEPVLDEGRVYTAEEKEGQPVLRCYGPDKKLQWELPVDGRGDLIIAGSRLYAASNNLISVIALPQGGSPAQVLQTIPVQGDLQRLLAADERLFAVTQDGAVVALGAADLAPPAERLIQESAQPLQVSSSAQEQIQNLLKLGEATGYALWFGADSADLLQALAAQSPFEQLAVIDPDSQRVSALRILYDSAGVYGKVTAHVGTPGSFSAPSYVAHMVFFSPEATHGALTNPQELRTAYESVRPYGGTLVLLPKPDELEACRELATSLNLEQAQVETGPGQILIRRAGALPGSGDWTHQSGDVANTLMSRDSRVKLPLGILWFGGTSNDDVLPRHGHGPPEQVTGGRLFIEGINCLSARDVYTGRLLWKREFKDLGTFGLYYDETYQETPLDPAYNQVHIPGANGRGTNYIATEDRVYIAEANACHVLDPATGELLLDIPLPAVDGEAPRDWAYIGVHGDVLIGGLGFAQYQNRFGLTTEETVPGLTEKRIGFGPRSLDKSGSAGLVGFNRYTGEMLWKIDALHSFWHNGIVAGNGRLYCLDKNPQPVEDALRRRGKKLPDSYRILSLDVHSGQVLWQVNEGVFGTWLGYSEEHDMLLQAGASASDRLLAEVGQGMTVYHGSSGQVAWAKPSLKYTGPCILRHGEIITNANSYSESAGAFSLLDGSQKLVPNPFTGELQPWKMTRAYGCNNVIASENLLTFRSGAAGFYDLVNDSGTGNFGGFKSGCTSNLVVANGVLNAPDYTRTCSCGYQNQTSLALVHMPELEMWTVHQAAKVAAQGQRISRLGLNFGGAGDRRDESGLLWLEYPSLAGDSLPLQLNLAGEPRYYRRHSSTVSGTRVPWIQASGVEGLSELTLNLTLEEPVTLAAGIPVSSAEDDAEEDVKGAVSASSSDLELVDDDGPQTVGLRFNNLNLARGTQIRSAHIQFTCDEPTSEQTQLTIRAEASGNSLPFTTSSRNVSSRPRTQSSVQWSVPEWKQAESSGEAERSPDIAALLQEIINRPDWEVGNSVSIIIEGTGKRVASASSGKGDKAAPRLLIDAEEAPAPALAKSIEPLPYRLRLYFSAPVATGNITPRRFQVLMNGEPLEEEVVLDPSQAQQNVIEREIPRVLLGGQLQLQFISREGLPCLSGLALEALNE